MAWKEYEVITSETVRRVYKVKAQSAQHAWNRIWDKLEGRTDADFDCEVHEGMEEVENVR